MSDKPKPCRVTGVIDGVLYEVVVTGRKARPVVGSKRVTALVTQWTGRTVEVTPTGPVYTVDPTDIRSVVALLNTATQVRRLEAAPDLGVRSPLDGIN